MPLEAFVYDAIRTPRGRGKNTGSLHTVKPISLVVGLIDELRRRQPGLDTDRIDDLVLGCATPVGDQGCDIAKTAALLAGLPETVAGVQINRFCASGLDAVNLAAQKVRSGMEDLVLAGGVESMSRVKMGSDGGAWAMDPETELRHLLHPAGHRRRPDRHHRGLQPQDVDRFAMRSQERAAKASANGSFNNSVIPVRDRNGVVLLDHDEYVRARHHRGGAGRAQPVLRR